MSCLLCENSGWGKDKWISWIGRHWNKWSAVDDSCDFRHKSCKHHMCQFAHPQLRKHWIEDPLCHFNYPLPGPLMCGAWGWLKVQEQPGSVRKRTMEAWFRLERILSSRQTQIKLVPLSNPRCLTGPQMARKRLSEFMKLEVSRDSMTSMWTALTAIQVNIKAHLLLWTSRPLVRCNAIVQGPNTLSPMFMKGVGWETWHLLSLRSAT